MNWMDTLRLAFRTVRANLLRTGLTVAIIAFGIMALVGIKTAITAMQQKFMESFSSMGANGFTIRYNERRFQMGGGQEMKKEEKGKRKVKLSNIGKPITQDQAEAFKAHYRFPAGVCINLFGGSGMTVSYGNKKTNPTVRVSGSDENFVGHNGFNIDYGRGLNIQDIGSGRNVCLIGSETARRLFGGNLDLAVDKVIRVNNIPFRIIGVLSEKGSSLGFSWDNIIVVSYKNARKYFNSNANASFNVQVKVNDIKLMEAAVGEATAAMRAIRKLNVTEQDNFTVEKSDSFVEMLLSQLSYLTGAALIIGFITLAGAAIGLMNIMLVAVTERTKEVGLIKAIGGKRSNVRLQFLFESIVISLMGAFFGILLGVIVGNIFSLALDTGFVAPWDWVALGIVICSLVGLLAGLYPALKASRLNPIEALRYE
ncbi:MAG TPA: ABC transporter permease [Flavitalea sp.]|nr:ABC transporter permease [Flavitalea sp.]